MSGMQSMYACMGTGSGEPVEWLRSAANSFPQSTYTDVAGVDVSWKLLGL